MYPLRRPHSRVGREGLQVYSGGQSAITVGGASLDQCGALVCACSVFPRRGREAGLSDVSKPGCFSPRAAGVPGATRHAGGGILCPLPYLPVS